MPYYPKSQIKTNLYAEPGKLLIASNYAPYTGYYWTNSQGKYWSGKTPQDLPTEKLILAFDSENQSIPPPVNSFDISVVVNEDPYYNRVRNNFPGNPLNYQILPPFFQSFPTQQDYQIGEFRRYFCKKTNEILYIEISIETYEALINQNPEYLYQSYFAFNIPWQLTGDKEQVYKTNRNIVALTSQQLRLFKFGDYLKHDYLKYYQ